MSIDAQSILNFRFNWKNHNPPYREDPYHLTELFTSVFAIHHHSWVDIHTLMNLMVTEIKRKMVIDKAREEAHQLHLEDPDGTPEANQVVPTTEPHWDPKNRDMPHLEHYRKCILAGT